MLPRLRKGGGIEAATPRIAVGGPIISDKLFVFQNFEYKFIRTPVRAIPGGDKDSQLEIFDSFTRVDYQVNAMNRLMATLSVAPQKLDFYNLGAFVPLDSTANLHQSGWFVNIKDQAAFRNGSLLQSTFSAKQFDANVFGNSGDDYVVDPRGVSGGWYNIQERTSARYELQEVYNFAPGKLFGHQQLLKTGISFSHTSFEGTDRNNQVRIVRADGSTSEDIYNSVDRQFRIKFEFLTF